MITDKFADEGAAIHSFVGPVRLELTTLRLKAGYSDPLSYEPIAGRLKKSRTSIPAFVAQYSSIEL